MKTKIFIAIIATGLFLSAFKLVGDKSSAKVDQQQGLYIFLLSKPVADFEYLGSVKKSIGWTGQPEEMLNSIIKKVKKEYPKADGVVFTTIAMDKADAIQFNK